MCIQVSNQSNHLHLRLNICLQCMRCMTSQAHFRTYFRMHWSMSLQDKLSTALDLCKWTKRTNHNFGFQSQHRDIQKRFFCSWKMCDIDQHHLLHVTTIHICQCRYQDNIHTECHCPMLSKLP
jgi:hypothetical protein